MQEQFVTDPLQSAEVVSLVPDILYQDGSVKVALALFGEDNKPTIGRIDKHLANTAEARASWVSLHTRYDGTIKIPHRLIRVATEVEAEAFVKDGLLGVLYEGAGPEENVSLIYFVNVRNLRCHSPGCSRDGVMAIQGSVATETYCVTHLTRRLNGTPYLIQPATEPHLWVAFGRRG